MQIWSCSLLFKTLQSIPISLGTKSKFLNMIKRPFTIFTHYFNQTELALLPGINYAHFHLSTFVSIIISACNNTFASPVLPLLTGVSPTHLKYPSLLSEYLLLILETSSQFVIAFRKEPLLSYKSGVDFSPIYSQITLSLPCYVTHSNVL